MAAAPHEPKRGKLARRLIAAAAVACTLAAAAPAAAAIQLGGAKGRPVDTTQAATPTAFNFHVDFLGSEHVKDLTTRLPAGIGPDLFHPTCPVATWMQDGCAANTQIGRTTVSITAAGLIPDSVTGRIYFLAPEGTPLPGLGIVLDSPTGKVFQRGEARINDDLGVLENTVRNFPRDSGGIPVRIDALDIVLFKTFIRNPRVCGTAKTEFLANSYEAPGATVTASDSYAVTGCAPVPPPRCAGRVATRVGTAGRDVIRGTAGRDVIVAKGGRDVVRGLGGNDVICGGGGPDRLFGGAGRDLLIGQGGADVLRGGPGRDVLRGGAGRNSLKQ
jgi:hypothetical protein